MAHRAWHITLLAVAVVFLVGAQAQNFSVTWFFGCHSGFSRNCPFTFSKWKFYDPRNTQCGKECHKWEYANTSCLEISAQDRQISVYKDTQCQTLVDHPYAVVGPWENMTRPPVICIKVHDYDTISEGSFTVTCAEDTPPNRKPRPPLAIDASELRSRTEHAWIAAEDDLGGSDVAITDVSTNQDHDYATFEEGSFKVTHQDHLPQPSPTTPYSFGGRDKHAWIEDEDDVGAALVPEDLPKPSPTPPPFLEEPKTLSLSPDPKKPEWPWSLSYYNGTSHMCPFMPGDSRISYKYFNQTTSPCGQQCYRWDEHPHTGCARVQPADHQISLYKDVDCQTLVDHPDAVFGPFPKDAKRHPMACVKLHDYEGVDEGSFKVTCPENLPQPSPTPPSAVETKTGSHLDNAQRTGRGAQPDAMSQDSTVTKHNIDARETVRETFYATQLDSEFWSGFRTR